MKTNHYAGIDPHIVTVIERETSKLSGRFGIPEADLADIRQDLHLAVWSNLGRLDRTVNREAAINRIVGNRIRNLIRDRQRDCRDWRKEAFSMNAPVPDEEDGAHDSLVDVLDLESGQRKLFAMAPSWHECREESADIAEAMNRLPADLRRLAATLESAEGNLSEVARSLGLSPKKARVTLGALQRTMEWLRRERDDA